MRGVVAYTVGDPGRYPPSAPAWSKEIHRVTGAIYFGDRSTGHASFSIHFTSIGVAVSFGVADKFSWFLVFITPSTYTLHKTIKAVFAR